MGIYIYTLRSPIKTVPTTGGAMIQLGQFKYGWKPFWGDGRSPVINSLRAAADRATDKLTAAGVTLFVQGDYYDGQPVHWSSKAFAELTEEFTTCPRVGTLLKDSRGRWFVALDSDEVLLLRFPEVGMFNGEDAEGNYQPKYYTKIGGTRCTPNIYMACRDALLQRLRDWR